MELTRGTRVRDRYTLAEFQGSGNFGEVWLAHDEMLDSDVALKIYMSLDPAGVEEFRSEYRVTQGVHHPNLLTPAYFDIWERRPFLVMKYCAAGSSSKLAGNTDEYTLWQFIHDVAAGLAYLHSLPEPIIHQDIKPDNILVDGNGRFLITDFGISKRLRATMRRQSQRAVGAGATAYMGPERFGSGDSAPVQASDIWSLGASIYELAMGELPFSGFGGGMQRNGAETPILDGRWSKEMNMVMQSCLAKETWERPTAAQLETYTAAILANEPAEVTWTPPAEVPSTRHGTGTGQTPADEYSSAGGGRKMARWTKIAIAAAIAIIIIAGVVIWTQVLFPTEVTNKHMAEYNYYGPLNKEGKPDGVGVAIYHDGDKNGRKYYFGNFVDGERQDTAAVLFYNNGNFFYGKMKGDQWIEGTVYDMRDDCYFKGTFHNNAEWTGNWYDFQYKYSVKEGERQR